jgi:adenine/guanine phosphoribosyltransferase-like PRPP-binding protein
MEHIDFVDFRNAIFSGVLSRPVDGLATTELLRSLIYRPILYKRNNMRWISVHSWRADCKRQGIAALSRVKRSPDPALLSTATDSVAALVRELFGDAPADAVTCVPCGHSCRHDCFGKMLAQGTARALSLPFVQLFADQPRAGSSHPKQSIHLPSPQRLARPPRSVLIVDDVATSGRHLEQAVSSVRETGASASAVAWISGSSKAGEAITQARPSFAA